MNKITLNRRYKKLQELIDGDDYFSEERIRMRDPLLYFLYVGQYKRNGNQKAPLMPALSEILTQQAQRSDYEQKLQQKYQNLSQYHDFPDLLSEQEINEEELEENTDELIRLMHQRFLNGDDQKEINYDLVDNNSDYDDWNEVNRELEERYFDDM
ncbi:Coiled-coil domain-containing protein 97 [Paramecium bursaria]